VEDELVTNAARAHTQVFLLRTWCEAQEEDQREVRIQVRHVLSGETRYFLAWPALTDYLAGKLHAANSIGGGLVDRASMSSVSGQGP
jgi:hypothetical protein